MSGALYPRPLDAGVARLVERLDANCREFFEERAGILEFDAGMSRLEAERRALIQTLSRCGFPRTVQARVLQVVLAGTTRWALTVDVALARTELNKMGGTGIVECKLDAVIRARFRNLAFLAAES